MSQEQVVALFTQDGALLEGHFRLTSGRHSDRYIEKARLTPHPLHVDRLAFQMAVQFQDDSIEVVVVPAVGAIAFGYAVSLYLTKLTGREVPWYYAEKEEGISENAPLRLLREGYYEDVRGKRVLLVDDVLTTGGSIKRLKAALPDDAILVAVVVIGDRGQIKAEEMGVPRLVTLATFEGFNSWPADECPICREGKIPLRE